MGHENELETGVIILNGEISTACPPRGVRRCGGAWAVPRRVRETVPGTSTLLPPPSSLKPRMGHVIRPMAGGVGLDKIRGNQSPTACEIVVLPCFWRALGCTIISQTPIQIFNVQRSTSTSDSHITHSCHSTPILKALDSSPGSRSFDPCSVSRRATIANIKLAPNPIPCAN